MSKRWQDDSVAECQASGMAAFKAAVCCCGCCTPKRKKAGCLNIVKKSAPPTLSSRSHTRNSCTQLSIPPTSSSRSNVTYLRTLTLGTTSPTLSRSPIPSTHGRSSQNPSLHPLTAVTLKTIHSIHSRPLLSKPFTPSTHGRYSQNHSLHPHTAVTLKTIHSIHSRPFLSKPFTPSTRVPLKTIHSIHSRPFLSKPFTPSTRGRSSQNHSLHPLAAVPFKTIHSIHSWLLLSKPFTPSTHGCYSQNHSLHPLTAVPLKTIHPIHSRRSSQNHSPHPLTAVPLKTIHSIHSRPFLSKPFTPSTHGRSSQNHSLHHSRPYSQNIHSIHSRAVTLKTILSIHSRPYSQKTIHPIHSRPVTLKKTISPHPLTPPARSSQNHFTQFHSRDVLSKTFTPSTHGHSLSKPFTPFHSRTFFQNHHSIHSNGLFLSKPLTPIHSRPSSQKPFLHPLTTPHSFPKTIQSWKSSPPKPSFNPLRPFLSKKRLIPIHSRPSSQNHYSIHHGRSLQTNHSPPLTAIPLKPSLPPLHGHSLKNHSLHPTPRVPLTIHFQKLAVPPQKPFHSIPLTASSQKGRSFHFPPSPSFFTITSITHGRSLKTIHLPSHLTAVIKLSPGGPLTAPGSFSTSFHPLILPKIFPLTGIPSTLTPFLSKKPFQCPKFPHGPLNSQNHSPPSTHGVPLKNHSPHPLPGRCLSKPHSTPIHSQGSVVLSKPFELPFHSTWPLLSNHSLYPLTGRYSQNHSSMPSKTFRLPSPPFHSIHLTAVPLLKNITPSTHKPFLSKPFTPSTHAVPLHHSGSSSKPLLHPHGRVPLPKPFTRPLKTGVPLKPSPLHPRSRRSSPQRPSLPSLTAVPLKTHSHPSRPRRSSQNHLSIHTRRSSQNNSTPSTNGRFLSKPFKTTFPLHGRSSQNTSTTGPLTAVPLKSTISLHPIHGSSSQKPFTRSAFTGFPLKTFHAIPLTGFSQKPFHLIRLTGRLLSKPFTSLSTQAGPTLKTISPHSTRPFLSKPLHSIHSWAGFLSKNHSLPSTPASVLLKTIALHPLT
ncbi:mucin-2-like [Macrobrachium nipponense]|uniref:mucin-2-like n=1 Tax=Macrobrachium nipponense TaxID=159736 RepID=UPI0030C8B167